jgi:hypothetical protein
MWITWETMTLPPAPHVPAAMLGWRTDDTDIETYWSVIVGADKIGLVLKARLAGQRNLGYPVVLCEVSRDGEQDRPEQVELMLRGLAASITEVVELGQELHRALGVEVEFQQIGKEVL